MVLGEFYMLLTHEGACPPALSLQGVLRFITAQKRLILGGLKTLILTTQLLGW